MPASTEIRMKDPFACNNLLVWSIVLISLVIPETNACDNTGVIRAKEKYIQTIVVKV